jgi:hypothetical protein
LLRYSFGNGRLRAAVSIAGVAAGCGTRTGRRPARFVVGAVALIAA